MAIGSNTAYKAVALLCFLAASMVCGTFSRVDAADSASWQDAVPVSIVGSGITVVAVRSRARFKLRGNS